MPRRDDIEMRLVNWARWTWRRVGRGEGYRSGNLLATWGEGGSGYRTAQIPIIDEEAGITEAAVQALEPRLRDTVRLMYLQEQPYAQAAAQLGCAISTVHARIADAHDALARWLAHRAAVRRGGRVTPGLGEG